VTLVCKNLAHFRHFLQDPLLHFSAAEYRFPFSHHHRLFLFHVFDAAVFQIVGDLTLFASRDSFGNPRDKLANVVATCTNYWPCSITKCNSVCISLDCHCVGVSIWPLSRALKLGCHDCCHDEHFGCNCCVGPVLWDVHGLDSPRAAIEIVRAGTCERSECVVILILNPAVSFEESWPSSEASV
jgi:hypothetical protein